MNGKTVIFKQQKGKESADTDTEENEERNAKNILKSTTNKQTTLHLRANANEKIKNKKKH